MQPKSPENHRLSGPRYLSAPPRGNIFSPDPTPAPEPTPSPAPEPAPAPSPAPAPTPSPTPASTPDLATQLSAYTALGTPEQIGKMLDEVKALREGVDNQKIEDLVEERLKLRLEAATSPLQKKIDEATASFEEANTKAEGYLGQLHDQRTRQLFAEGIESSELFRGMHSGVVGDLYEKSKTKGFLKLDVPESGEIDSAALRVWDPRVDAEMGLGVEALLVKMRDTPQSPERDEDRIFAGLGHHFLANSQGPGGEKGSSPKDKASKISQANSLAEVYAATQGR